MDPKKDSSRGTIYTDHLIIGTGISGLTLALKLANSFGRVMVITKELLIENNTSRAQGGIASVLSKQNDSFTQHISDTLVAGAGLCRKDVVAMVVQNGPKMIHELIKFGVEFTKTDEENASDTGYHLTKEGGHSQRRVIHSEDLTGKAVLKVLIDRVKAAPNIELCENQLALELLTTDKFEPQFGKNFCLGAYILDRDSNEIYQVRSKATYICTGGHGRLYQYTSNYDGATGDGLAMGWRAGCKVANLEFMQFHPTCLYGVKARTFLISEAVRGEGAIIRNAKGEPFIDAVHPLGSLAPRDVVAQAIDAELKRSGTQYVYLDARNLGKEKLMSHFPHIYETCRANGIDMVHDMVPVVPAAHYSCGGLVVDSWGRTEIRNLFAVGEVACSGLHGANRLASNSLLEGLVFADRVAQYVQQSGLQKLAPIIVPNWNPGDTVISDELVVLSHIWDEIRRLMWNYVGIVRTTKRLQRALQRILLIRQELDQYYWNYQVTSNFLEVRNLADVAFLTIRSALTRKESRGIHFSLDFPEKSPDKARDTIIW